MSKKTLLILLCLTTIGGFLRFYNLSWGNGHFFHPDERNIASAVLNLHFPNDLNPNFFAYGSFPIYVTYTIGLILKTFTKTNWLEFEHTILIGRALSASLSTLLIPLVYLVTKQLIKNEELRMKNPEKPHSTFYLPAVRQGILGFSLLSAFLTVFTPGLIQYAHFSTFEVILTFEYLLSFYFALKIAYSGRWSDYIYCSLIIGASVATKITSILILPVFFVAHLFYGQQFNLKPFFSKIKLFLLDKKLVGALFLTIIISIILSPFNILDHFSFLDSMKYETGVAKGSLPVFYSAQFLNTYPFWYQVIQIFPYILGLPLTAVSFLAWSFLLVNIIIKTLQQKGESFLFLLILFPTLYFLFHGPLFVKWTRYMIPLLPFLIIITVITLFRCHLFLMNNSLNYQISSSTSVQGKFRKVCKLLYNYQFLTTLTSIVTLSTFFYGLSFFSIYLYPDTRVSAAEWAAKNLPPDAKILSEVWDLGITPFNTKFPASNITLFNFYELDSDPRITHKLKQIETNKIENLSQLLSESEYIVIPSQRIYKIRLQLPEKFPLGSHFYQTLFDSSLGFEKVIEFDVKPFFLNEEGADETFKVFDHPKIIIFKKNIPMTQIQYLNLLTIQLNSSEL